MENLSQYAASILEYLQWQSNEEGEDTEAFQTQKRSKSVEIFRRRKCLKMSKKRLIRMIAAYVFWTPNTHHRRRRKIFKERSLVRMIASKLPLKPSRRTYFEIFCESNRAIMSKAKVFVEENLNSVKSHMPEMGLADIGLFTWDDFDDVQLNRKDIITRSTLDTSSLSLSHISEVSQEDAIIQPRCIKKGIKLRSKGSSEKKIIALEDELANLRAQIAMIVSSQGNIKVVDQMVPPPPPPPPLPPPIKAHLPSPRLPAIQKSLVANQNQKRDTAKVPAMKDVLVGLSTIKLKSSNIQRSPGGTPLKIKSRNNSNSSDPADIIANALRRKFATARRSIGSPSTGKENQISPNSGFTPSPSSSPDSPFTSSPHKDGRRRSNGRQSNKINGRTIVLSPVNEN